MLFNSLKLIDLPANIAEMARLVLLLATLTSVLLVCSSSPPASFSPDQTAEPPQQAAATDTTNQTRATRSIANNQSPCPRAFKINTNYQFRGSLHFVCLEATRPRPRLEVIRYFDRQVVVSREINEFGAHQLTSFVDDDGTLRILLAEPNRFNGTSMYSVDKLGHFVEETHTINTQDVSAMTIWRLELNYEWNLAIANQPSYEPLFAADTQAQSNSVKAHLPEPKPMISIHSWRSTYFDSYQIIDLPHDGHVNKIEPMYINGQEFLIVAMDSTHIPQRFTTRQQQSSSRFNQKHADSLIYKLDYGDGNLNWVLCQTLNVRLAMDVKSFRVTHSDSPQQDYYIALLGQFKPGQDQVSYRRSIGPSEPDQYGLIIYKYLGDQFLASFTMPTPGATKLDAITYGQGDSYVIIGILSEYTHTISLYLFDGLDLKSIPNPMGPSLRPVPNLRFNPNQHARRTLDSPNLHLFLAPDQSQDIQPNETNSKRDFIATPESTNMMPLMALSRPSNDSMSPNSIGSSTQSPPAQTLYRVHVSDIINDEMKSLDGFKNAGSSNEKRDQVSNRQVPGPALLDWCRASINTLIMDNFDSLSQQVLSLPRVDQHRPIELNGDLIIEDDLYVSNLLYADHVLDTNSERVVIEQELPTNFTHTFEQIRQTHFEIDHVKQQVDQILVDDGSVQDIFNPITFETLIVECPNGPYHGDYPMMMIPGATVACPHIDDLHTERLNNRDIRDIQKHALLTGRSQTVTDDVRFEHLVLRGQVDILGTLNGLPINEIVFKHGPYHGPVMGHKNFRNGLYSQSQLHVGQWNRMPVDRFNYLTSSGEQRIESNIKFGHIIFDSPDQLIPNISSRIERINGLHLDAQLDQIALSNGDTNFEVPIHFEELVLDGPIQLSAGSYLSSLDIENWWANTMFKQSSQNISAPFVFAGDVHVSYGGDIAVNGLVNGIEFIPDHILMRNKDYILPNPIVFDSDLFVRELQLDTALNGIQVASNPVTKLSELAILYDGGEQEITGDKVFNEVSLGGHSLIGGNINGQLNLKQLYDLANQNGTPHRFTNIRLTAQNVRVSDRVNLHIESSVNGIPTSDLCSLALHASQQPRAQYGRLKFEQEVDFKSIRCASINGFGRLTSSFLTKQGDQRVFGTIKLAKGVLFNTTINIRRSMSGLDVSPLARAIASVVNETRTGHKVVYGNFHAEDLRVRKINDLNVADIFETRSDKPQIVRAPMSFHRLDIESVLTITENLFTDTFNNLNVTDILSNTLQYDTPQVIYNRVDLNTLQLLPDSDLRTNSLNGYDISKLYADAVLKDVPQQILAPKIFRAPVELTDHVFMQLGIDGLSEDELRFNMLLHSDELIEGDITFNNDVTVKKELEIQSNLINEIDFKLFVDSMLYENNSGKRSLRVAGNGSVRFKDVQLNNLVVGGTIQGIDLSKDALLRDGLTNGSYNAHIRDLQASINNNRILNRVQDSKSPFLVQSSYHNTSYYGNCFIHSCPQSTARPPGLIYPMPPPPPTHRASMRPQPLWLPLAQMVQNQIFTPPSAMQPGYFASPGQQSQFNYNSQMPQPVSLVNMSQLKSQWKPNYDTPHEDYFTIQTNLDPLPGKPSLISHTGLIDPKLEEHRSILTNQRLQELSRTINKQLSIPFYYEFAQNQPQLGPLLHAARGPIYGDPPGSLLLLKSTVNKGEPCARIGQTISVMAQVNRFAFTQDTTITETTYPTIVDSLIVGNSSYLFVLDAYMQGRNGVNSHLMVYLWDNEKGMYDLVERIPIDGAPIAMKAFSVSNNRLACVALANPGLRYDNLPGPVVMHCQATPRSDLNQKIILPVGKVFDLDLITDPLSPEILIASLSQNTEHFGDLQVFTYNMASRSFKTISLRRVVSPMKLHFIRNNYMQRQDLIQLVVSEAITSNNNHNLALTRIFSIKKMIGNGYFGADNLQMYESQVISDGQFYDIQSVPLDNEHSLLFLQSINSISIYAPTKLGRLQSYGQGCDAHYSPIQQIPSRGANKFLVFENHLANQLNATASAMRNHFLVLSKDLCEHQQFHTVILKSRFN